MIYLAEKGRIPASALSDVHKATADQNAVLRHVPVDETVAMRMADVSREDVPDLPDRLIAATALEYAVPVLSRDGRIRASGIATIW